MAELTKEARMKVFISYTQQDKAFVVRLSDALRDAGFETWVDDFEISVGDNLIQRISEGIQACDYIIPVISRRYTQSQWARRELNAFAMREVSDNKNTIIPVLIEDCEIPVFLRDKVYADFRSSFDEPLQKLIKALKAKQKPGREVKVSRTVAQDRKASLTRLQAAKLRQHLRAGELVLVCGAGVSVAAGVPTWPVLLNELLASLFRKQIEYSNHSDQARRRLAQLYQEHFNSSPLVVAQYLKNGLGNDFLEHIRRALYSLSPSGSDIIDAIAELCRPQRSGNALRSIITFNFDDLIEHNLDAQHIKHRAIFAEGQRSSRSELPVYHVHGYLPRTGNLTSEHEIVFSEDAYHSQFIDPFSWANLTQLNHFGQNVCVFLGLSMTDPNLRRLLDVSMRKNPGRRTNHYVFKKRYDRNDINARIAALKIEGDEVRNAMDFMKIVEMLEETDANNLGMNVIWIDDYGEISEFLRGIAQDETI
jgi:hypothetical protein